jgi:hypothetical protein
MAKPKKSRPTRKNGKAKFGFQRPVVAVSKEELHFAIMAAAAAGTNRTPRQSFASNFQESIDSGQTDPGKKYLVPTDDPLNHMAFAIMDAFPEKT